MKKDLKRQIITALAVTAVLGAAGGMTAHAAGPVLGGKAYVDTGLKGTVSNINEWAQGIKDAAENIPGPGVSLPSEVTAAIGAVGTVNEFLNDNTIGADGTEPASGDAGLTISGDTYGAVGGDLSVNTGLSGTMDVALSDSLNVVLGTEPLSVSAEAKETNIVREGDVKNEITGGSVIGGVGGSAAAALGNMKVELSNYSYKDMATADVNVAMNGKTGTTIDGSVTTAISNNANVTGWTNGGLAAGIGGTASSTVKGNTTLNISDGSATAVTGGGTAVTTFGGTAEATVGGSTTIEVNNAKVIGVIGGGAAASVDATGIVDLIRGTDGNTQKGSGNDNKTADLTGQQIEGILSSITGNEIKLPDAMKVTATNAIDGGTAMSKTGDTNISLKGTTTAAGVFGGGAAAAYHTYQWKGDGSEDADGNKTDPGAHVVGSEYGSSTAAAETGKSHINIALTDGGTASGVFGGGAAFAYSETGKGVADGSGASAAATTKGSEITVIGNGDMKDHVGGLFGGGAAVAFNWAKATAEMTDTVDITIANADVSGAVGGGLAYFTGTSPAGENNLRGMATAAAKDTNINVQDGSTVAGILGGGIAIDDSQADWTNAKAETTGTATINVNGGTVTKVDVSGLQGALKALDQQLNNPNNDPNYKPNDVIEYIGGITNAAEGAAIAAGGVALSDGAVADVANAVVNINGGTVDGNIYGGGIAAYGYSVTEEGENGQQVTKPVGGSHVGTSTINLNGGTVTGNVYAGGAASSTDKTDGNGQYTHATATVDTAVINLAGTTVDGILYGTGTVDGEAGKTGTNASATVGTSTLNVIGTNTLKIKDSDTSKIQKFDAVNFKAGSETVLDASFTTGKHLIDGGKVTVEDGALLNIKDLPSGISADTTGAASGNTYTIAANTDDTSTFWDDSDLIYDRMNGVYATTAVTNPDGDSDPSDTSFSVKYDKIDTTEEANAAADSMTDALGVKDLRGMFREGMNDGWKKLDKDSGAGKYLDDWQMAENKTPYQKGMLFGEDAAVTGNTVSIARAMADNVTQRLSFTDDYVQEQGWANQDGGVWAKYMHRKYETDGMSSSVGGIRSGTDYDGILVGMDLAKNGKFQSGVAIHYGSGEGDGLISHNDYDAWGITLYGGLKDEEAGTNLMADIGWMTSDNDIDGTVNGTRMSADRDVDAWTIGIRGEKEFVSGKNQIVPYAGLRYMSVNPGSYTTYYGGKEAFHNDAENQDLWLLPIGVSFRNETVTNSGWRITPKLDLSYIWAFGDTDTDMTVNAGGYTGSLYYDVMDDSSWLATLGVEAEKDAWTFGINYGYQKGDDTKNKTWYVTAGYSF